MKPLMQVFESINMDDDQVLDKNTRDLADAERVNAWFKEGCPALYSYGKPDSEFVSYYFMIVNGKVHIRSGNFDKSRDITIYKSLPSFIKFADLEDIKSRFVLMGREVTSMKGLPDNMPNNDILIDICTDFDFSDNETKTCGNITIRDTSIKSFKHAPKAKAYKLKSCRDLKFDEKAIARFSGTNRSRITIL